MANVNQQEQSVQKAGSVIIEELNLISAASKIVELKEFLVELNLYEDIFSNTLYGDIVLSDSRNLIDMLPIVGEEYLNVHFYTPTLLEEKQVIRKTFRVYRISKRQVVRDNNTQVFVIHFASKEMFADILLPVFRSFEGKISDLAFDIFEKYLKEPRNYVLENDNLNLAGPTTNLFVTETSNQVKFVSPGWTPLKIINWLASKALPKNTKAASFLFFETNANFYFTSLEEIFKTAHETQNFVGTYSYAASNIKEKNETNLQREYFLINDIEMVESTDHVRNYNSGYLANRLLTLDVFNKKYELIDFDYVEEYKNFYHTSGTGEESSPLFTNDGPRNPATNISFYPVNPRLFENSQQDYYKDNVNEKIKDIYGSRKSSLLGLNNAKLNITVPGRSDIEVGRMLYLNFPALGPVSEEDKTRDTKDQLYSGYYLITAIHHRVTLQEHVMIMEIVKDSASIKQTTTSGAAGFPVSVK